MSKTSAYFTLGNLDGKHDMKAVKRDLDTLPGVLSVSVSSNRVAVDFDSTGVQAGRIEKQLEQMGYQVIDSQTDGSAR